MPVRASFCTLKLCLVLGACPRLLGGLALNLLAAGNLVLERSTVGVPYYDSWRPQRLYTTFDLGSGRDTR